MTSITEVGGSIFTWNSENHFSYSFTYCQSSLFSCKGGVNIIPSFIQLIQIKEKVTPPHQKKLKILFSFFCCDPVLLLSSGKAKSPLHLQETFNAYINLQEAYIEPKKYTLSHTKHTLSHKIHKFRPMKNTYIK